MRGSQPLLRHRFGVVRMLPHVPVFPPFEFCSPFLFSLFSFSFKGRAVLFEGLSNPGKFFRILKLVFLCRVVRETGAQDLAGCVCGIHAWEAAFGQRVGSKMGSVDCLLLFKLNPKNVKNVHCSRAE